MALLGPRFWPQNSPQKVYVGPFFFAFFPRKWGTSTFFWGGESKNGGFGMEAKKFMLKKFMCFFRPILQRCKSYPDRAEKVKSG